MKATTAPINFSYKAFTGNTQELYLLDKANDARHWSETSFIGNHHIIIATHQKQIIGFIIYTDFDSIEILRVLVAQKYRQFGVATRLIQATLGKKTILEVRENNHYALNLYHKLGFKTIHTRKNYYKDGTNALIMQFVKKS